MTKDVAITDKAPIKKGHTYVQWGIALLGK